MSACIAFFWLFVTQAAFAAGPPLLLEVSHFGDFSQRQFGAEYALRVTNVSSTDSSSGQMYVSAVPPAAPAPPNGIIPTTMSGQGWDCPDGAGFCSRNDVLGPGESYPVIIQKVDIEDGALPYAIFQAKVLNASAGGQSYVGQDPTNILGEIVDLTIDVSHVGNFSQGQIAGKFTFVVTNHGFLTSSGKVKVVSVLPPGMVATAMSGVGWSCTYSAGQYCQRTNTNDPLARGESYPPITLWVSVAMPSAPTEATNSVTVTNLSDSNDTNDTVLDSVIVGPKIVDLAIDKSHVGNFSKGQTGATYTLKVTNVGALPSSGQVKVTDVLPTAFTVKTISGGPNWSCVKTPQPSCVRSDSLAGNASYEPIVMKVDVSSVAPSYVINTATVQGGGDANPNTINNTDNDFTLIGAAMVDMSISKSHAGLFTRGQAGAIYTLVVTNLGMKANTGTVTVSDALPAGLSIKSIGGTNWTCTKTPVPSCTRSDPLATGASYEPITLAVNVAPDATTLINTASVSTVGDTNTTNNVASDPTSIGDAVVDLAITKSHAAAFSQGQVGATYKLAVTNLGGAASSGVVTVKDMLPATMTVASMAGTGWTCPVGGTTCTRSDSLVGGGSYPPIVLTVNVAANASNTTNTANLQYADSNSANNFASDPTTIGPPIVDLAISKSHAGDFSQGQTGAQYHLVVTNLGAVTSSGTVQVIDVLPPDMMLTAMGGTGWDCPSGGTTCTRNDPLAKGASYPPIVVTVDVSATAQASVLNYASVANAGDGYTGNNLTGDLTTIAPPIVDLAISKSHVGNFSRGQTNAVYTLIATNVGAMTSSGMVAVADSLPAGMTASSMTGPGWSCELHGTGLLGPLYCTRSDALGKGESYPPITLALDVAADAPASVTNQAAVFAQADGNSANNNAGDPTLIDAPMVDLAISKSHVGNFSLGQSGAQYTLSVTNVGALPSAGTVSVLDTLPPGLTAVSMSGAGWNCPSGGTACTRSDVLGKGESYPPITLTVNVSTTAGPLLTNKASVTNVGNGNPANDVASDPTFVGQPASDLKISKSHVGNFSQGQKGATYTLSVTNVGALPSSGVVSVLDTLPPGLTITSMSGANWTCAPGGTTCNRSDALASGASYEPIAVIVDVSATAAAQVTNTATVTNAGDSNASNDSASDPTSIGSAIVDFAISKTHSGNFSRGQIGAAYTLVVSNVGALPSSSTVTMADTLPTGLTAKTMAGSGWQCSATSVTCRRSDPLAGGASYPPIVLTVDVASDAPAQVTNTAKVGNVDANPANNTASDPTLIGGAVTDLAIRKHHVGNFSRGQVGALYTIDVTNVGGLASSGQVTVSDTLPNGLRATAIEGGPDWQCTLMPTLGCTRSDSLESGASFSPINLTVQVLSTAPSSVINWASVANANSTNHVNNTSSDLTQIDDAMVDLTMTMSHVGNFSKGQTGAQYTLVVTNLGQQPTSDLVRVVDTLPAGLTVKEMIGAGWDCSPALVSCVRTDSLVKGGSYPPITLTVDVSANAPDTLTNTAAVTTLGDNNATNDIANDPTQIDSQMVDLTIDKSHAGSFSRGQTGATYTLVVSNVGALQSSGTVSVSDVLPTGLALTAVAGTNWECSFDPGSVNCVRNDDLAAGASYEPITLTVDVASSAADLINSASVTGSADGNALNNADSDATVIGPAVVDLTIGKSHAGNFRQGQGGAQYALVVTNLGGKASTAPVAVADALPPGLTLMAMSGAGWTCVLSTATCTRSDALAGGGSYEPVVVTVDVAANAPATVLNTAALSNADDTNAANDSAYDSTMITPAIAQTIAFLSVPPNPSVVGGTYTVTAAASSGLPVALSIDASSTSGCTISGSASGSTVSFVGVGICVINANQGGGGAIGPAPQVQQSLTVVPPAGPLPQTITFASLPPNPATVGGASYNVIATATSNLAVKLVVDSASSGVCTIAGSTVSFVGAGSCTIDANQGGNAQYAPAPQAQQLVLVSPATGTAAQTITFLSTPPNPTTVGGPAYGVVAKSSSNLPVTLVIDSASSGVCTITGSTVTFVGAGSCLIDANQGGNSSFAAAPQAQQVVRVDPATGTSAQTITFQSVPPTAAVVGGTYDAHATADSGLPVILTIDATSAGVCTITGSTVTFVGTGNCLIDANQGGNAGFAAAAQVQQPVLVGPAAGTAAQTITFLSTPSAAATVGGTYQVLASATSGLPVTLTIDSTSAGVCVLTGSTVTFMGAGSCTIDANQGGSANFAAASQVQQSVLVHPAMGTSPQSITFLSTPPSPAAVGGSYDVLASASSGLPVVLTIDAASTGVCTSTGPTVTFVGPGTCVIDANQGGSAHFAAAPQVQQAIQVDAATGTAAQVITFLSTPPGSATVGGVYQVLVGSSSGLPVTLVIDGSSAGVCTLTGSIVTFVGAGSCTIDADQAGDSHFAAAPQAQQVVLVNPATGTMSQAISILSTPPNPAVVGGTYDVQAKADSGLPVVLTIDAASTGACTLTGSTVSFSGAGSCLINADQGGNSVFAAAPRVTQSIDIEQAVGNTPQTITITSTPPTPAFVGGAYAVAATASSGLTVTLTIDQSSLGICTIAGSTVAFLNPGLCTVAANQSGDSQFAAAAQVTQQITVMASSGSTPQAIAFSSVPPNPAVVGGSYAVAATATSGLQVTLVIDAASAGVCTIAGSLVSFVGSGSCVIDANQPGDAVFAAAPQAQQVFLVEAAHGTMPQVIAFTSTPPNPAVVGATYDVVASASSGLQVTLTIDVTSVGVCDITATTVTFLGAGNCLVTANQGGNATFAAAPQVAQLVAVQPASGTTPQTIAIISTPPSPAIVGDTYDVAATATSGLPVSLTIDAAAASVCALTGSTVTFVGAGSCVIDANQGGNTVFAAAAQVAQSITVHAAAGTTSQTITISSTPPSPAVVGATYDVLATASSGLPVVVTIDSASAATCTITGSTVTFVGAGSCMIDVDQGGDAMFAAAPRVSQLVTVQAAGGTTPQTITIASIPPNPSVIGASYRVLASASSGLPVMLTIDAVSGSRCTISGSMVTFVSAGSCVIDANQGGDAVFTAAAQVQQSVTIQPANDSIFRYGFEASP